MQSDEERLITAFVLFVSVKLTELQLRVQVGNNTNYTVTRELKINDVFGMIAYGERSLSGRNNITSNIHKYKDFLLSKCIFKYYRYSC